MSGAVAPARRASTVALIDIQAPVRDQLELVVPEIHRIIVHDLPAIDEVTTHLLRTRGKMFRPMLSLLAGQVEGERQPAAVTLAAAIELMHLATLVHDDSVDHSVLRRGLPTVNAVFSHEVSVIMGDFLYSRALRALVRLDSLEVMRIFTDVTAELAVGEMRQLAAVDTLGLSESDYVRVIRSKTGSLLSAACEAGAIFGAPRHRSALAAYGDRLGLAFQITDDLLDYTEDATTTGKPTGLDLKEHKVTLPLIGALPRLTPAARGRVEALFADETPSAAEVAEVISIVADAGGLEYARRAADQFAQEAQEALATLPDSPARVALGKAIVYVMERRS